MCSSLNMGGTFYVLIILMIPHAVHTQYANCSSFNQCDFPSCTNMFDTVGYLDQVGCSGISMKVGGSNNDWGTAVVNVSYSSTCAISDGVCMYVKNSGTAQGVYKCCFVPTCAPSQYVPRCNCTLCPAGSYCSGGPRLTGKCAAGTYSVAGQSACTVCASGTYSTGGQSSCTICAYGTYSPANGSTSCMNCPTTLPELLNIISTGQPTCNCAPGQFFNNSACTNCAPVCSRGSYEAVACSTVFNRACVLCPTGTYSFASNRTSCSTCPKRVCLNCSRRCPANQFMSGGVCYNCSVSCPVGLVRMKECAEWRDIVCGPCPTNSICNATNYISCPNATCRKCASCVSGTYSVGFASVCTNCSSGIQRARNKSLARSSSLPLFLRRSRKSKISPCQGSR